MNADARESSSLRRDMSATDISASARQPGDGGEFGAAKCGTVEDVRLIEPLAKRTELGDTGDVSDHGTCATNRCRE
jgi:hypothetical protein